MTLSDGKEGENYVITGLSGGLSEKRLSDMGVFIGAFVRIIKKGGFLNPIEIKSGGTFLALRKKDAEKITVEKAEKWKKYVK